MPPRSLRPFLLIALLASAGACTSTKLVEDKLTSPEAITSLKLGDVRFDYSKWKLEDADSLAIAKTNEAAWMHALGGAMLQHAAAQSFSTAGSPTRVDVTVVDLDPGSKSTRFWIGFGAGSGTAALQVDVADHGSFRMNGSISWGSWGGDFVDLMEVLGGAVADHIVKRARGTDPSYTPDE